MPSVSAPATPTVPVRGGGSFQVHRIYCVGRNFADHAREMGASVPPSPAERGRPVFFLKPADAIVTDGVVPYPPATADLHHEVELVVALGRDAPPGELRHDRAGTLVFGYAVGLDLTRRDLQAEAKSRGLPWDIAKGFDYSAPISDIVAGDSDVGSRTITLLVNGERRQHAALADMIWSIADVLVELSRLYILRAGDLVFMGTPAGVGPLQAGDTYAASIDGMVELHGSITPPLG
jgi:2-keto-4-pentenoate hydratase/2-oxohepta-3-ene-1,7-dioic acid hydratase in catechol pathway